MNAPRKPVGPELRVTVPQHVVHRDFEEQTVIMNLETGEYFELNRTAGQMFSALEGGETIATVAQGVATATSMPVADVERDLRELCGSLLERGLVERVDVRGPSSS